MKNQGDKIYSEMNPVVDHSSLMFNLYFSRYSKFERYYLNFFLRAGIYVFIICSLAMYSSSIQNSLGFAIGMTNFGLISSAVANETTSTKFNLPKSVVAPVEKIDANSYSFANTVPYGRINLFRSFEFKREVLEEHILKTVPLKLRPRLKRYLSLTIKFAEAYQVDPFWALSVMYTESHFNTEAVSHAQASGLMQIMPKTAHFIAHRMNRPVDFKTAQTILQMPAINIEMGIFYLKMLVETFKGNYTLATVAYNMGPGNVVSRLRNGLPVGTKNQYLDKVNKAYSRLTAQYKTLLKKTPYPYKSTLLAKKKSKVKHNFKAILTLNLI